MEGQLHEHPLAELISEILEKKFSGALRVERERVKAVVYFEAGEVLYATANLRSFRLIEYLKKLRLDSDLLKSKNSLADFALAEGLISRRLLTQLALDEIFAEQVSDVMRVLLLWTSGSWTFDWRSRLTAPVRVRIQIKQLLLDATRRMDFEFASSRFQNTAEMLSAVTDSTGDLNLSATEGFLLSRVEGPMELGELLTISGLSEPDARRTVYGLVLTGLLKRELWPYAFRTSDNQEAAARRKIPSARTAVVADIETKVKSAPPRNPQQELEEFLDQLANATNHYEVLNVSQSADAREIKHAYYSLARRFHPDRFHELARTPLHARLESAFARITQAHEMLSNPDSRATYDMRISGLKRAADLAPAVSAEARPRSPAVEGRDSARGAAELQAEERFKEGVGALQQGQINTAISCLSAAARLAPNHPPYRAYYGSALATHQQTRRMAEVELQAAVKLDPTNASYRVMLAGLYRDLGFSRRAITELERALSLDPKNLEAHRMLESLEVRK
jgi:tetratricopeptide (TPR) repeat protein